ncbi:MAG: Na+/H+ antiporter NhaC family protein [bacterium]|nr:Na+/H+ antiporter NhaC family protein [bacterium]
MTQEETQRMKKKGSIVGLLPLFVFLVLYMGIGFTTGSFDNLPLMVGILIAVGVALSLQRPGSTKETRTSFDEKVQIFCQGGGDHTLILMVLIFILAGAFYSIASGMHAVDTVVNIGLSVLPSNMILPGLFLIGCLLSFAMGTSMGTIAALMPIGVDIANKTGVSIALVCGIVIGGAMFGDNLSFISDTTIAATRTQEVKMKDKFKMNILMVLPAVIINLIALFTKSMGVVAIQGDYSFNLVNILPYLVVILFSLLGLHVVIVMALGVVTGIIIGVMHGDFTIIQSFSIMQEGMSGMQNTAIIAVLVGGMAALMQHFGGIDYLLEKLSKRTKSARGGELSIAAIVSLLDIATTNNTVSIITAGPIARDIADEYHIDRRRVASILDVFSSAFNGLLPYGAQLLVAAGLAQVAPVDIMGYNWYSMLMLVSGLAFICLGWPNFSKKAEAEELDEMSIS